MKKWRSVFFVCLVLMLLTLQVSADMGPKPRLTITVTNPPQEPYYLDLLVQNEGGYEPELDPQEYQASMLEDLRSLESEGWYPAYSGGHTYAPLWGDLIGQVSGENRTHTFGYVGLPDQYRIIIATESGEVQVSDIQTRKVLQSHITFDYPSCKVTSTPVWISYLVQFACTFLSTLLIEGLILCLFRFRLRENWLVFLLMNLGTQILLTATMGVSLIRYGTISAYFTMVPVEGIILAAEVLISIYLLHGYTKKRRALFALCANLTSCITGFLLMSPIFQLIVSL